MERELWPSFYRLLQETAKDFHQKYVPIQPWVLVAVMLWAARHDRPVSWACRPRHWSTTTRKPWRLPSPSTLSRRMDGVGVGLLLRALEQRLRDCGEQRRIAFLDGKPLPVGGDGKDKDARFGRGAGGVAKGYKRHAAWSLRPMPEAWDVTPRNVHERTAARAALPQLGYGGYLLVDGNDDASDLFDAAWDRGCRMLTPLPAGKNPGGGKHYQSPHRWRRPGADPQRLRQGVVTGSGRASSGASATPRRSEAGWGRCRRGCAGRPRVRSWVWTKLLMNGVRILRMHDLR